MRELAYIRDKTVIIIVVQYSNASLPFSPSPFLPLPSLPHSLPLFLPPSLPSSLRPSLPPSLSFPVNRGWEESSTRAGPREIPGLLISLAMKIAHNTPGEHVFVYEIYLQL